MMRTTKRIAVGASLVLTLLIVLLARRLLDLGNQYSAFTYFRTSVGRYTFHSSSNGPPTVGVHADDKVVVMAKMESEDTEWVAKELQSLVSIRATTSSILDSDTSH